MKVSKVRFYSAVWFLAIDRPGFYVVEYRWYFLMLAFLTCHGAFSILWRISMSFRIVGAYVPHCWWVRNNWSGYLCVKQQLFSYVEWLFQCILLLCSMVLVCFCIDTTAWWFFLLLMQIIFGVWLDVSFFIHLSILICCWLVCLTISSGWLKHQSLTAFRLHVIGDMRFKLFWLVLLSCFYRLLTTLVKVYCQIGLISAIVAVLHLWIWPDFSSFELETVR